MADATTSNIPGFTKDFFAGNRARLRQSAKIDQSVPIVITANGLLQRNGDVTFKFRQDSNFWYLTGLDDPDVLLVMDGDSEYLIVADRDAVREAFDGVIDSAAVGSRSGITEILDSQAGWERLTKRLKQSKRVAGLDTAPAYINRMGLYTNPARRMLIDKLMSNNAALEFVDVRETMVALRASKQSLELQAIQRAIDVTIEGIGYITDSSRLPHYDYEYQLEADLLRSFKMQGTTGHAFEPIVTSGVRACTLHNLSMEGRLQPDELLLVDVGAEYNNYAADISRTFAIDPQRTSARQRAVHAAVCSVQDYAFGLLKPGVMLAEYEKSVSRQMADSLRQLGLAGNEAEATEAVRRFYPHATSHFMGLDVHDVGVYSEPLAAGMVLTCEPGIYLPEEGIGVRIEDDVLITETGCEILSRRLPRQL